MPDALLIDFASANDAAAATRGKLAKQQILADYFRGLDETDLRLAVRYCAGRAFASTDERVLGASGAIVSEAILSLRPMDGRSYYDLVVRSGEIGEALTWIWLNVSPVASPVPRQLTNRDESPGAPPREAPEPSSASLRLKDLGHAFDHLASTGNQEQKRSILRDLFSRCIAPREATYLAKIIFSDLRTGVKEGVLQAGVAQAFDRGLAEIQRCQLLVGDLEEVAVLARRDELAAARFRLFHPIQFMLATPQETALIAADTMAGRTFCAEDKLDGIRAQVHKSGEGAAAKLAIYTRTMDRTDESFPDVVAALRVLPGEFLLDGEIVPMRDGVVLPFAHIQRRLGRKVLTPALLRQNPCVFVAFDILYRDGMLLMDRPLRERRAQLEALAAGEALVVTRITPVTTAEEIDRTFCTARDCRNEGLVLKDPGSIYSPGRRGQAWLKLKTHLPTLDCVVTAAEYGHGKRKNVLSDYTFAVWDKEPTEDGATLVNIGKAYSGVTDEEIGRLTELFLKLSRRQFGRVHAVEPRVVLEIACDQIQKSSRHASGYALRFPRIKRIRWDKGPADADRLQRVVELYQSHANTAFAKEAAEPSRPEPTLFDGLP